MLWPGIEMKHALASYFMAVDWNSWVIAASGWFVGGIGWLVARRIRWYSDVEKRLHALEVRFARYHWYDEDQRKQG